jgi:ABC-type antimicrobial peptide transport system permease subunit
MFKNYFKVAVRNLLKHKSFSFINIAGLSMGMAITMLIGLWVWDELSYDRHYQNYDRIAEVWQTTTDNEGTWSFAAVPLPLANELRQSYPDDFKYVVPAALGSGGTLSYGDNKFNLKGSFLGADAPEMLALKMQKGSRAGLKDPASVMLDASTARKLFGSAEPIGQLVKLNNQHSLKVTGVYEDLPHNSTFSGVTYMIPWDFFMRTWDWVRSLKDNWESNSSGLLIQLQPHADIDRVSRKIRDVLQQHRDANTGIKTALFLHPMRKWHLYSEFQNGKNTGGLITFVWLFGVIGAFVLLLACINFMNLSTARSEKRAREVGIRKAIGSERMQLIGQFFSESVMMALFALMLSVVLVQLALPWFNKVAGKNISVPWLHPGYWLAIIGFSLFTGLIAGSYPAIYLSSFQPIKVLKGTFRAGKLASIPRKVLVVVQFTVSILLITGTVIVFRQIQYAKDRPVGYERQGLISIAETTPEVYRNYNAIRQALLRSGAVTEMAESQCPVTDIWATSSGYDWKGKPEGLHELFALINVRHEYGKALGWQFTAGRDFSSAYRTDSMAVVLNETAVKYMGLKDPIGEIIRHDNKTYTVIGVVKDMIMRSPYDPVPPTIFGILHEGGNIINIKIKPDISISAALQQIEQVFKKYNPAAPFEYSFVDQEYAKKFGDEERIAKLSAVFAGLAILISCLGLFGLASFMAEQRTKEIGIRKVLGASVFNLWRMLSKDFVALVLLSCCIAVPVAWYFLHQWLQRFEYRTSISVWIFFGVGAGAIFIALSTVSYQAVKTALSNPVKSLRAE